MPRPRVGITPASLADEKRQPSALLPGGTHPPTLARPPRPRRRRRAAICLLLVVSLWNLYGVLSMVHNLFAPPTSQMLRDACPQQEPWVVGSTDGDPTSLPELPTEAQLAQLLSGAVRVNTSVYDDYPTPVDDSPEVWSSTFTPFRLYLQRAFPTLHEEVTASARRLQPSITNGRLTLTLVNQHAMLYEWKGTDETLKPVVFMAHQDVVPVDETSLQRWSHQPFGGEVDESRGVVWGRGASDDKSSLVTLLAAFESLLKPSTTATTTATFEPRRTLVLAFGFDEEASGSQGAGRLAQELASRYGTWTARDGRGGVAMVVDEGEELVRESEWGFAFAAPSVAEKGYLDVRVTVRTPGGHSSSPPRHSAIGILSRMVSAIEDQPPSPRLRLAEDGDVGHQGKGAGCYDASVLETLLCLQDAPKMGTELRASLAALQRQRQRRQFLESIEHRLGTPASLALYVLLQPYEASSEAWYRLWTVAGALLSPATRSDGAGNAHGVSLSLERLRRRILRALPPAYREALTTTQAVTLVQGGTKVNALPEYASAVVNHRIEADSSTEEVRRSVLDRLRPLARRYGLELDAWGHVERPLADDDHEASAWHGTLELRDAFGSLLEPSLRTPTSGDEARPYQLLSSVIRSVWTWPDATAKGDREQGRAKPVRVVPTLMTGNTDSSQMRHLSRHIFRFSPSSLRPDPTGIDDGGIHTVDEHQLVDALPLAARFYASMFLAVQTREL